MMLAQIFQTGVSFSLLAVEVWRDSAFADSHNDSEGNRDQVSVQRKQVP
jgi:hypothetical protein